MWSNGNVKNQMGRQRWIAAAEQHSANLQEIRGTGPLVPRLMGMDMRAGSCQVDIIARHTTGGLGIGVDWQLDQVSICSRDFRATCKPLAAKLRSERLRGCSFGDSCSGCRGVEPPVPGLH